MSNEASTKTPEKKEASKHTDDKWAHKVFEQRIKVEMPDPTVSDTNEISYKNLAYGMLIPATSLCMTTGIALIPQHDLFDNPGYWYEAGIPLATAFVPSMVFLNSLRMKVFFDGMEQKISTWIKWFIANFVAVNFTIFLTHFIWTDSLGYAYPIPWLYTVIPTIWFPFYLATTVLIFPKEYRKDVEMRKRILWFIVYKVVFLVACYERLFIIFAFLNTPFDLQPIWAIVLPIWRECDLWMLKKVLSKCTAENNRNAQIFTVLENQCNHTGIGVIALGLYATDLSSYCILISELLLKLYISYGIGKINKKIEAKEGPERKELQRIKNERTQDLILDEVIEVMMPIVYVSMVLLAFYGPNAAILGNIGCEKWTWIKIANMNKFLTNVFRMFAIDSLALVLTSLVLWKNSSANIMKQLCTDIKSYWPIISVVMSGAVIKVCIH